MTELQDIKFDNFLKFVEDTQPKSICLNNTELRDVFDLINDTFSICSIIIDHDYVNDSDNYYSLLVEFRDYYGRFLLALTLNDEFLISSLFRLIVEKLYRIIFGFYNPHKSKNSIKRHTRSEMSSRLTVPLNKKAELDDFYKRYSDLIHHSTTNNSDRLDLRGVYFNERDLINTLKQELTELNCIFIEDYVIPLCTQKNINDLSFIASIDNRISNNTKLMLEVVIKN